MKRIFASLISVSSVALLGGCVSMQEYDRVVKHLENEQQANVAATGENERLAAELNKLRSDNSTLRGQVANMKTVANDTPAMDTDRLLAEIRRQWGMDGKSGDFEFIQNGASVGVRLDDSAMLFNSGSWILTADTKTKLSKLADLMKAKLAGNDAVVRVDGHTDTDPISKLKAKGIEDNVHLSTMRAMAVRNFLVERGIAKNRIFVAGFGELWPCESGASAKAKQRNRRVEIFMGTSEGLSIGRLPGSAHVSK